MIDQQATSAFIATHAETGKTFDEVHNEVDNIATLINRTCYRLERRQ